MSQLSYRIHTEEDIDALVDFWRDHSGWDNIDRTEWERRFMNTPYGNASVAIAEDASKQIVAQMIFIPSAVNVDERMVKAYRPFAMVVKKNETSGLGYLKLVDMIYRMYTQAIDSFKKQNIGLIHMIPDPRWSRILRFLPALQIGGFPLWSLSLSNRQKFDIPAGYEVEQVTPSDERIDALWEESRKLYGCTVLRNTATLPWKTSHGDYKLTGISKEGVLKGLVVSIAKFKDKQWLICDMLTTDAQHTLTVSLEAACNQAMEYRSTLTGDQELNKVAILCTPLIEPSLEALGFKKDNYKFPMLVHLLDPTLSKKQVAPERWYASAND